METNQREMQRQDLPALGANEARYLPKVYGRARIEQRFARVNLG